MIEEDVHKRLVFKTEEEGVECGDRRMPRQREAVAEPVAKEWVPINKENLLYLSWEFPRGEDPKDTPGFWV